MTFISVSLHIYDYVNDTQLSVTRTLPVLICNKGILSSAYRGQHYDVLETVEQSDILLLCHPFKQCNVWPHFSTQKCSEWRNRYVPKRPGQVEIRADLIRYTYGQLHMHTEGSAVRTRTPIHWNLTGHSMTVPPLVLSPSSILPQLVSLCFHSSKEIFGALLKNVKISFFKPFKIAYFWKCVTWYYLSWGVSVYRIYRETWM